MKRVYFHIGAPKTGTTFIQETLWEHRETLAAEGICYPIEEWNDQLGATVDLCERPWGGRWEPRWHGAWDRVAEAIRSAPGDRAVFSGELMGLASPEQVARAVASVQPAEVHVIYTARDLARQLPSDWQEQVKHRHTVTLTRFVDDLVHLGRDAPAPFGELFWGLHDPVFVLARWDGVVPLDRIHVVTVPQAGAAPGELWNRFTGVVGIEPARYQTTSTRDNSAMGRLEAEFLRRFNLATRRELGQEHGPVINRVLGQEILATRDGALPIRLPREHDAWVRERSATLVHDLAAAGYDVVGDLADLVPAPRDDDPNEEDVPLEQLPPVAMNRVAFHAVAGLVEQVSSLRVRSRRLAEDLDSFFPGRSTSLDGIDGPYGDSR